MRSSCVIILAPQMKVNAFSVLCILGICAFKRLAHFALGSCLGRVCDKIFPFSAKMWYNKIIQQFGSVAQLVEQRPEEPCVTGSSPVGATRTYINRHFGRFFRGKFLLSTLRILGCYFMPILHEKWGKNCNFTPVKSSVNTLNNLTI